MQKRKDLSHLKDIFAEQGDDMSRLERKKTSRYKIFLIGLLIAVGAFLAVFFLTILIFGRGPAFSGDNIELIIDAPARLDSGDDVFYALSYANLEDVPLRLSELSVTFPAGFVSGDASPSPSRDNNLWNLGTLPAGKAGKIEIKGKLLGEADSIKTISAVLSYTPSNFSSQFQKVATAETVIGQTPFKIEVDGPTDALPGDKIQYLIKITNQSDEEFTNLKLIGAYPAGFQFVEAKPAPFEDNNTWTFAKLAGGETLEISLKGELLPGVEEKLEFNWQFGFETEERFIVQQEAGAVTDVVQGELSLSLVINGANESKAVNFGDTLNYSIVYKNNSDTRLSELIVKLTIDALDRQNAASYGEGAGLINFDSLRDINDGVVGLVEEQPQTNVLESRIITWTKKEIVHLTFLDPNEEGVIDFTVKLKDLETLKGQEGIGSLADLAVSSQVEMIIGKTGNLKTEKAVRTNTIVNALNTNLRLTAEGRYFDAAGDQLGSGPLPPRAGETTKYRIFWQLNNDLHEVKDVKVFAVLPKEVDWTNDFKIAAGEMEFNSTSRTVSWTINRMPESVKTLEAQFELALTPTVEQAGDFAVLLPRSVLTAIDTVTNGKLTLSSSPVTTDLESDPKAQNKGIVQ